jgi:hypothetical protein
MNLNYAIINLIKIKGRIEEDSDKVLQALLKTSLSSSIKNLAWYSAVQSYTLKTLTVVEVGVAGGGSLAIAALAIARNQSQILMTGSKIIGFDLFEKVENFSEEDKSSSLERKFAAEMALRKRTRQTRNFFTEKSSRNLILSSGYMGGLSLVSGDCVETIPKFLSENSAIDSVDFLRISCNWYKPVRTALEKFMPYKPSVIYLDGYYHWEGFRRAVKDSGFASIVEHGYQIQDCHVFSSTKIK